jgi:hypothetical protein
MIFRRNPVDVGQESIIEASAASLRTKRKPRSWDDGHAATVAGARY